MEDENSATKNGTERSKLEDEVESRSTGKSNGEGEGKRDENERGEDEIGRVGEVSVAWPDAVSMATLWHCWATQKNSYAIRSRRKGKGRNKNRRDENNRIKKRR